MFKGLFKSALGAVVFFSVNYSITTFADDFKVGDTVSALRRDTDLVYGRFNGRLLGKRYQGRAARHRHVWVQDANSGNPIEVNEGSLCVPLASGVVSAWDRDARRLAESMIAIAGALDPNTVRQQRQSESDKFKRGFTQARLDRHFTNAPNSLLLKTFFGILETHPVSEACETLKAHGLDLLETVFVENDIGITLTQNTRAFEYAESIVSGMAARGASQGAQDEARRFIWSCMDEYQRSVLTRTGVVRGEPYVHVHGPLNWQETTRLAMDEAILIEVSTARKYARELELATYNPSVEQDERDFEAADVIKRFRNHLNRLRTDELEVQVDEASKMRIAYPQTLPIVKAMYNKLKANFHGHDWDTVFVSAGFDAEELLN